MYLSRNDIEKISKDVIAEYMQLPRVIIQKDVTKIDPFILSENLLGLKVDFKHLSEDKLTFGLTSYFNTLAPVLDDDNNVSLYPLDGKTILIEKDLAFEPMVGKFNFTISHEAAHHILRKLFPKEYGPQVNQTNGIHFYRFNHKVEITDWEEWQATVLAAAILMPEDLLKKNMITVGLGEKMHLLHTRYSEENFFKFCRLSTMMGVSVTALRIRMKYLGLLERDFYCNPRGILDIDYD